MVDLGRCIYIYMLRALYNRAVVAARCQTLDDGSAQAALAAIVKLAGDLRTAPAMAGVHSAHSVRASTSHRHALGGLAARDLRAWCSGFFSWLPLSHELPRACLHQGGTFRCAATRARALSRECSRAPVGHCLAGWGMAPKTLS